MAVQPITPQKDEITLNLVILAAGPALLGLLIAVLVNWLNHM